MAIKIEIKVIFPRVLYLFFGFCFLVFISPFSVSSAQENTNLCDHLGSTSFDNDSVSDPVALEDFDAFAVVSACEQALLDDPDNPRFHFQLGVALAMLLEVNEAIEHLELSASKGYQAAEGFLEKYRSKLGQETRSVPRELKQNDAKSRNECDRIGSVPIDVRRVGQPIPVEKYEPEKVVNACKEALKGDPGNPRFHFQLGIALLGRGEVDDALVELQTAASQNYVAAKLVLEKFNEKSAK